MSLSSVCVRPSSADDDFEVRAVVEQAVAVAGDA
jgi:hypothetical protein